MKILIATTNVGKFKEICEEFSDLPYQFVSLKDVNLHNVDVPEPHATTWQNALDKAVFYGKKSKLLTFAEDTGFFVPSLGQNSPGIKAKRYAKTPLEACQKILTLLKGKTGASRKAFFKTSGCLYDPKTENHFIFNGRVDGTISNSIIGKAGEGMIYDVIFKYPPKKRNFSELSMAEKNLISHRGQTLRQLKRYLTREFGFLQFVVPLSVVVKDRKMLLLKRRDSRPEYNNKWELPGGGIDNGETIEECVHRETKEETGFTVKILRQLPGIPTAVRKERRYQIFVVFFITKVLGGSLKISPSENSDAHWCTLKQLFEHDQLPLNKKFLHDNLETLKEYID